MKIIQEQAFERQVVRNKIENYSTPLSNHICKLAIYDDSLNCKQHWIKEIAEYISIINDFYVKPKAKKLSADDYLDLLFKEIGEDARDVSVIIRIFAYTNNETHQYPKTEVTQDMIDRGAQILFALRKYCEDILPTKNEKTKEDIESDLLKLFSNIK